MAKWTIQNVSIVGISACVPRNVVYTKDLECFNLDQAKAFDATAGILSRRIALPSVCASDLAQAAAQRLMADLNWNPETIDLLIFESVTPDYRTPPTSCVLQHRMGLTSHCCCIDLPVGCCGTIHSIAVAANMLASGCSKRALLLIGDTAYRMGSPLDKSRAPLFGDGASAIALEYNADAAPIVAELHTLGAGYTNLMTPHGGYRHPSTIDSYGLQDVGNGSLRAPIHAMIDGMNVFAFAIGKPPATMLSLIEQNGWDKNQDVDFYLIHQANKLIVDRIVRKMQIPKDKVPTNLDRFGNLGGASIPSLVVTELRDRLISAPATVAALAFGLGLSWGALLMHLDKPVIPALIEV